MDLISGITTGVVTLVILVTALVVGGFIILFRRRGDRGIPRAARSGTSNIDELRRRAGTLLVRADDLLREADDELGFAIAQFGADKARPYAATLAEAREKVTESFRLKQALDDHIPDSARETRQWTLQIIALCEQATAALSEQDAAFGALRAREVNAAGTLQDVRSRIEQTQARVAQSRGAIETLTATYGAPTVAAIAENPAAAAQLLAIASSAADAAEPSVSAAGVSAVSDTLQQAGQAAHRADQLLDAVERTATELAAASDALTALRARTRSDLAEAKAELADAPDADTGRGIIDAMAAVDAALAPADGPSDPVSALDRIGDAVARLDLALASARNQTQRLQHAREAYAGTLISAKSQIGAVRDYIGSRGGGVGARTRLAEAERQLMLAEAASDPVEALDTVRRAVTHARDADALARYNGM